MGFCEDIDFLSELDVSVGSDGGLNAGVVAL